MRGPSRGAARVERAAKNCRAPFRRRAAPRLPSRRFQSAFRRRARGRIRNGGTLARASFRRFGRPPERRGSSADRRLRSRRKSRRSRRARNSRRRSGARRTRRQTTLCSSGMSARTEAPCIRAPSTCSGRERRPRRARRRPTRRDCAIGTRSSGRQDTRACPRRTRRRALFFWRAPDANGPTLRAITSKYRVCGRYRCRRRPGCSRRAFPQRRACQGLARRIRGRFRDTRRSRSGP